MMVILYTETIEQEQNKTEKELRHEPGTLRQFQVRFIF